MATQRKNFKSLCIRNVPIGLIEKMQEIKDKEGMSFTSQIRRALRFWFKNNDETIEKENK